MCSCTERVRIGIGAVCVEYGQPKWPITIYESHTHTEEFFINLFLAPHARTTRYEEAFISLENQEKKARFAHAPPETLIISY